jgi:hypothetical protein
VTVSEIEEPGETSQSLVEDETTMMITCLSPQSPTSPEKTCVINEPLLMHTRLAEKTALRTGKPLVACHNDYRSQSEGRT